MSRQISALILLLSSSLMAEESSSVRVCDGEDEWPPFTYIDRVNGEKTGVARGFAHRVLRESLPSHWQINTTVLPWSRCLRGVENGEYDLTLNVSYSDKRAEKYTYSLPYVFTHIHFFYSSQHFSVPPVNGKDDLKKLRNCGISGHNYALVGLSAEEVDQGANDISAVFAKISRGRCDVFTHSIEDVEGYLLSDPEVMQKYHIAHAAVSDVKAIGRYFLLSKHSETAQKLIPILNNGVMQLQRNNRILPLMQEESELARQQLTPVKTAKNRQ